MAKYSMNTWSGVLANELTAELDWEDHYHWEYFIIPVLLKCPTTPTKASWHTYLL